MRAASLFTGIGGLDLAVERAGFEVVSMCEIDPYNRAVLRKHWPNVPIYEDIRNVTANDIQPGIDLIFGGFPCQDISIAGRGAGINGDRSGLFFDLLRITRDTRPRCVVLENVSAINVRGGTTVIAALAACGYDCVWTVIRAADVGAPHIRQRWFCIAVDNSNRKWALQRTPTNRISTHGVWNDTVSQQQHSVSVPPHPAGESRRRGYRQRPYKSRMGGDVNGLSPRMDIHNHEFPAGSWQDQKAHEPPRLAPATEGRTQRLEALGKAVVPQQAYPIFAAVYAFLTRNGEGKA